MTTLTVFYEGRVIGQISQWQLDDKKLLLDNNALGFLEGMVIELTAFTNASSSTPKMGALVRHVSPSRVLIQLDELLTFGLE